MLDHLEQILHQFFLDEFAHICSKNIHKIGVAYSGGLDSSVLLHALCQLQKQKKIPHEFELHALHINHGLQPQALEWQEHCQTQAEKRGIIFHTRRVQIDTQQGIGIEAAAREVRYAALFAIAQAVALDLILTAHHADDQVETFVLQLLRGAGLAGLTAMPAISKKHANILPIARPLLNRQRRELEAYASKHSLLYIEDFSNQDTRYTRNAIRLNILPMLDKLAPHYRGSILRAIDHLQDTRELVDQISEQDWQMCALNKQQIVLSELRRLSSVRARNVLRYWLQKNGLRAPGTKHLQALYQQMLNAKDDGQPLWAYEDIQIRRYKDTLELQDRFSFDDTAYKTYPLQWKGEAELAIPIFNGRLLFKAQSSDQLGIDADWLMQSSLNAKYYHSHARIKLHAKSVHKTLKNIFQQQAIPVWQRQKRPCIYAEEKLIFVPGIGVDCSVPQTLGGIFLEWQTEF